MSNSTRLPYPGLRPFRCDESDLFFGREGCVDDMVDRLKATRFLAVLGASGSGKSSLVATGLLDALELGLLAPAGPHWRVAKFRPGGEPICHLAEALVRTGGERPAGAAAVDVHQQTQLLASFLTPGSAFACTVVSGWKPPEPLQFADFDRPVRRTVPI